MPHEDMLTLWTEHGTGYRGPAFFARIAKSLGQVGQSAYYVVPNAAHQRIAEALCLAEGPDIFFGNRVLSYSNWILQLAQCQLPLLSPEGRRRHLHHLMSTLTLQYFRPTSSRHSGTDTLSQGITAAAAAGITPQELARLAQEYGQEREQDLAHVAAAYWQHLATHQLADPAQLPTIALQRLRTNSTSLSGRIMIDVGISPPPILWEILRAAGQQPQLDLHVILPEMHRHRAESALGEEARMINAEEWVASTPAQPQLFRVPNVADEYRWLSTHIRDTPDIAVLTTRSDITLWLAQCMDSGLLRRQPLPLTLAASPISAPWHDPSCWTHAPQTASLSDWTAWWQDRLYPNTRIQDLADRITHDDTSSRVLRHIAHWGDIWRRAAASVPNNAALTASELRDLIDPILHGTMDPPPDDFPVTIITPDFCLGNHLREIVVPDAAQDHFPKLTASAFFRRAVPFPQDPNADRLRAAFPGSDDLLSTHMAAWQRLLGCADAVTGIYSASHDNLGEQFQSPFFESTPIDIASSQFPPATPPPVDAAPTLLSASDTISDVQKRMQDHVFSITELETFADCPFRHFARYILGIDVPDEETVELPARDEGQIIHRLLEQFYAQANDRREEADVRATLSDLLTRHITTSEPLRQIQIARLLAVATAVILWDREHTTQRGGDALHPTHLEWKFGYGEAPALRLRDGDSAIQIRGKVDRIDTHASQKRLLLMDYKFKRQEVSSILADIRKGLHLQIPLYVLAAQAAFPEYQVLGGLLFDLNALHRHYGIARKSEGDFLGIRSSLKSLLKEEAWDEILRTAETHALHYARQIRQGIFPLSPHRCEYCDWKGLLPWENGARGYG